MPRKYIKKQHKRTNRKRKQRRRAQHNFFNAGSNMPLKTTHKATFRYFEGVTLAAGAFGVVGYQTFSANSLYDPNVTGVGHQPAGFDELMSLYLKYQVIGAKIRINLQNNDTNDPIVCGIYISADPTPTVQLTGLIEGGAVKYKTLGFGSQASPVVFTAAASIKKRFGIKGSFVGEDIYQGSGASSPSSQLYFHVFACAPLSTSSPSGIPLQVQIDYIAVLTEPISLSSS